MKLCSMIRNYKLKSRFFLQKKNVFYGIIVKFGSVVSARSGNRQFLLAFAHCTPPMSVHCACKVSSRLVKRFRSWWATEVFGSVLWQNCYFGMFRYYFGRIATSVNFTEPNQNTTKIIFFHENRKNGRKF